VTEAASHLGGRLASRDPEHLATWRAALMAGRAKKQCVAVARTTGERCRAVALKYSDQCMSHCHRTQRFEADQKRLAWFERELHRNLGPKRRAMIETAIAGILRRRLLWLWRRDPTVPGRTIALPPVDQVRVDAWLRQTASVDPEAFTPRGQDRLRWAGALCLARRATEESAMRMVRRAVAEEDRWLISQGHSR
jgi:hypothetical protein